MIEQAVKKSTEVQAKPVLKWAGGKTQMLSDLMPKVPASYGRYIEPFFGGGAMYFYLRPQKAIINDISNDLTSFYKLAKEQNKKFYSYLCDYDLLLNGLINYCDKNYSAIIDQYTEEHPDYRCKA